MICTTLFQYSTKYSIFFFYSLIYLRCILGRPDSAIRLWTECGWEFGSWMQSTGIGLQKYDYFCHDAILDFPIKIPIIILMKIIIKLFYEQRHWGWYVLQFWAKISYSILFYIIFNKERNLPFGIFSLNIYRWHNYAKSIYFYTMRHVLFILT